MKIQLQSDGRHARGRRFVQTALRRNLRDREASQAFWTVLQSPKDEAAAEKFERVVNLPLQ